MKEGLIFDLDGVLLSTDAYHARAWKAMAQAWGIAYDEQISDRLRGVSRRASLLLLLGPQAERYTEEELTAMCEQKNGMYRKLLEELTPQSVDSSVRSTLAGLRAKGLRLAVGSSSRNGRMILEKTALMDSFDVVIDGCDITHTKPHPEVFLKCAEGLGLAPEACVVVEDAQAGVDAAVRAGMVPVAIGPVAEKLTGAAARIRRLEELEALVLAEVV